MSPCGREFDFVNVKLLAPTTINLFVFYYHKDQPAVSLVTLHNAHWGMNLHKVINKMFFITNYIILLNKTAWNICVKKVYKRKFLAT